MGVRWGANSQGKVEILPSSTGENSRVDEGIFVRMVGASGKRAQGVDTTPQAAILRADSGTRDSSNPAVRFQNVERQPELSSGLFLPEKRDFGVIVSQVHVQHLDQGRTRERNFVGSTVEIRPAPDVPTL